MTTKPNPLLKESAISTIRIIGGITFVRIEEMKKLWEDRLSEMDPETRALWEPFAQMQFDHATSSLREIEHMGVSQIRYLCLR